MIAVIDPATRRELSAQQLKQVILPSFFDFIQVAMEIDELAEWDDGTLEITVNGNSCGAAVTDTFYYREGLFYTRTTKNFEISPDLQKRYINVCQDDPEGSLCTKGCGCGCLTDIGYMHPSVHTDKKSRHCKD